MLNVVNHSTSQIVFYIIFIIWEMEHPTYKNLFLFWKGVTRQYLEEGKVISLLSYGPKTDVFAYITHFFITTQFLT